MLQVEGLPTQAALHHDQDLILEGQRIRAQGHFFTRIYPRYRMASWQAVGWRADQDLPALAAITRLDAVELQLAEGAVAPVSAAGLLAPWVGSTFALASTEFESGGLGTGRKCLEPGGPTPAHSTGAHQEREPADATDGRAAPRARRRPIWSSRRRSRRSRRAP